jgi:hypothetical protein
MPDILDFSNVKITEEVDFSKAKKVDSICKINIYGTDISKIKLRYEMFKLYFPKKDNIPFELQANVYEQLLNNFKKNGYIRSYEKLDKEYKELYYIEKGGMYKIVNLFQKYWWGYGYDKLSILLYTIGFFVFFWSNYSVSKIE